jgi:putative methyltransferase (TIGR04325 family)
MFVLSFINLKKPFKIIELGGACGATYFSIKKNLADHIGMWTIVETPQMVLEAKEKFADNILNFISIDEYETKIEFLKADIFFAQGVLQYLKDPLQFFETLQKQNFQYIYISRTVVGEKIDNPIITKQITYLSAHGPGEMPEGFRDRESSQPLTIIPFDRLKAKIQDNYHIQFLFSEGENQIMQIDNQKIETKMIGILLKQTDSGGGS